MPRHAHPHAFGSFHALDREGLLLGRRNMFKAGLAGMAGLTLPGLLKSHAAAAEAGRPRPTRKSVILLWMTGGPSHIDTFDPKPDRPRRTADRSTPSPPGSPAFASANTYRSWPGCSISSASSGRSTVGGVITSRTRS